MSCWFLSHFTICPVAFRGDDAVWSDTHLPSPHFLRHGHRPHPPKQPGPLLSPDHKACPSPHPLEDGGGWREPPGRRRKGGGPEVPSLGSQPSCGVQVTVLGGQWEPESPCWWGGELGVVMGQDPGSHLDAGWKRGYGGLENSLCCPQSKHQPLLFFFFFIWPRPRHTDVPRPGIKPVPQSSDPSRSSDNAESLTAKPPGNASGPFLESAGQWLRTLSLPVAPGWE